MRETRAAFEAERARKLAGPFLRQPTPRSRSKYMPHLNLPKKQRRLLREMIARHSPK